MSTVKDRSHAERITREAAQAIGLHVPDAAYWDLSVGGLQLAPARSLNPVKFAPLNDPADAYRIEIALKINVFYRAMENESYVMSFRCSQSATGPALMKTVNKGDDALRLRMEAVTFFASLHLIMMAEA